MESMTPMISAIPVFRTGLDFVHGLDNRGDQCADPLRHLVGTAGRALRLLGIVGVLFDRGVQSASMLAAVCSRLEACCSAPDAGQRWRFPGGGADGVGGNLDAADYFPQLHHGGIGVVLQLPKMPWYSASTRRVRSPSAIAEHFGDVPQAALGGH